MPITEVTYQPNSYSLNAAYIPIVFRCKAKIPNATTQNYICPVVYCDIYVEGIYYKSLSRSQYISDDGIAPEYEFDIQDAIQELMDYNLPKMEGDIIEEFKKTIKKIFVKFRNSYTDANGFNISEQLSPVQGTSSTLPTAGGGTISNEIYILNSVIQHEENQNLDQLLNSYKTGIWGNAFPLTKRPKDFKICKSDSSHFPIVSAIKPVQICIKATLKSGQIVDICSEILDPCPKLQSIQYTIIKDIPNNSITFNFSWTNPPNMLPVPYEIKIYKRIHGSNDPWSTLQFTAYPNPITSQTVITPLGYYDFVFEIIGACKGLNFNELPSLINIGGDENELNNPPVALIRWDDTLTVEDRVCTSSVCNFVIENYATDPDNDIVLNQVFKSTNGSTWNIFVANATQSTFSDSISVIGSQYYKVVLTDSQNNVAESNVLKYTKQQSVNPSYIKLINGINCTANGDGPTNYTVWCTALDDFSLSDVMGITSGYIRLKVDGGNYTFGLSKFGGGYLIVDQVLPITQILTASYGAAGQNPPSAWPWGYQSNEPAVYFQFEYSLDGVNGWTSFQFILDD
ncbi:hypothetical protein [Chryseobacterium gambrini]|uniref:hypothetical protein n=1 Tax=Chryseobacterium gambrini TaxID=373672 RepID=UPI003D133463